MLDRETMKWVCPNCFYKKDEQNTKKNTRGIR